MYPFFASLLGVLSLFKRRRDAHHAAHAAPPHQQGPNRRVRGCSVCAHASSVAKVRGRV